MLAIAPTEHEMVRTPGDRPRGPLVWKPVRCLYAKSAREPETRSHTFPVPLL